jgi:hypothetical protein
MSEYDINKVCFSYIDQQMWVREYPHLFFYPIHSEQPSILYVD